MILRFILLVFLCMSLPTWAQTSSDPEELKIQRGAISETLEQPLRKYLLKKGYTPRNAAIAASSLLDAYARCLAESKHTSPDSEPEFTTFRLGEATVSAYKSPCLTDFLNDIADIP